MNRLTIELIGQYSVAWMNTGTLAIGTSIATLFSLYSVVDVVFQSTKSQFQDICHHINQTAEQIHQVPSMMQAYLHSLEQSIRNQLCKALMMLVTIVESVLLWLVDMYKSTYRCLLAFAINTTLAVVTSIAEPLQKATETVLKGVDSATNTIGALFNHPEASSIPTSLSNWTLSMEQTQQKVNQWTNGTDQLHEWLSTPFESLKQHINATFVVASQNNNTFNSSTGLPSNSYCNATSVIQDIQDIQNQIVYCLNVTIGILFGAIVVSTLIRILYLWYCHRYLQRLRYKVLESLASHPTYQEEEEEIPAIIHRNHISAQSAMLARYGDAHQNALVASITYRTQEEIIRPPTLLRRWCVFVSHSPMLWYCLLVSLVGLCTTYSMIALVHHGVSNNNNDLYQLDQRVTQWFQDTMQNSTNKIQQDINTQWQTTNQWITTSESTINNAVFGTLREFALPINSTLDNIIQHLSDLITTAVGGTIMETPAKEVLDCLVLNKLDTLQQGIEWIIRNSYIELPRIEIMHPFTLEPKLQVMPSQTILNALEGHLQSQIYFFWILFSLWIICAIIGFIYVKYTDVSDITQPINKVFVKEINK
ncbi:uncharacterized protein BX664DRAFT_331315 [Halteromyces radiatus]|uniref:uncharacterized protein n=1 Tax=Halteromyces radiatus TaxID=101107 RepID=UPI00221F99BF|nr:uncharacterized protein BX664DRAFT_331315 [Halteromyces radiatus]KAI8088763.1 hypothetical protein BX664DRAFT_331315 [Halteromyces radiatus]